MWIDTTRFSLSLSRPLETARGAIDAREGFLITVERAGERGIGEATPLTGWTESLAECERALERAIDEAVDARRPAERKLEGALDALDALDANETPAARHGFAMALADLRAREARIPLYRELGGTRRAERVAVNATIGDGSPEESARVAKRAVENGFRCLKVKVGARAIEEDTVRLRSIRESIGDERVELRADANGAWSLDEAHEAFAAFERATGQEKGKKEDDENGERNAKGEQSLAYVEQPLAGDDLAGHAALGEESEIAIALDETLLCHPIETVLESGAADVLICKPMALGGLDRARAVALRAREEGVVPVVTTTIDGAIARAGAAHLAASLVPIGACGLATASMLAEDVLRSDPISITDGYAPVPQTPGTVERRFVWEAVGESDP